MGYLMQRLFSTFAAGWPGAGLLLLRLFAGVALIHSGMIHTGAEPPFLMDGLRMLSIAAGALLMAGFLTPVVGALAAVAQGCIAVSQLGDPWSSVALATLAAALAMIGPGAWSLDARRFGRKRIKVSDEE